jgi:uncharacterized protein YuzE
MELTYDREHNIAYIRFRTKTEQVRTVQVGDELNIDLAPDGTVYGIELLNANQQLVEGPEGRLQVRNLTTGQSVELPLAG